MIRFVLSFFGAIFSFVTLGAAVIALSIGAVFWVYGRDLPSHESLAQYQPKTISRIYSSEGKIIDEFAVERRLFAPADEIPDLVKHAFISAEDKNFYTHGGYDTRGMVAAAVDAVRGGRLRGASTIPQQVVKNFLLSSDRSAERKIKELILSVRLENTLSKEKILELYLNEIYLGQNSYGVAAAAQTYFNKALSELTVAEAAYLGALPQRPAETHPVRDRDFAISRRNYVLREMYENGYIEEAVYEREIEAPLRTVQNGDFESYRAERPDRDYFTDEIRRQLSRDFGEGEFFTGGFTVRATLDPEMQVLAAASLRRQLEQYDRGLGEWRGTGKRIDPAQLTTEEDWRDALSDLRVARDIDLDGKWHPAVVLGVEDQQLRLGIEGVEETEAEPFVVPRNDIAWLRGDFHDNFEVGDVVHVRRMTEDDDGSFIRWTLRQVPGVQGGFMAMDVNTGRVIAMQGGFSYQHSVFNRATQANRQPGSSFKPFVYASALDVGYTPATIIIDAPIEIDTPQGLWRPTNASHQYYGPTPLRTGIERSRNLMTVRLAQEVGMDTVADYAEKFGVYDNMGPYLANALGSEETTLYKMVSAYAMFANGGERVEPTLVDRVQDRYGRTIYRHDQRTCTDCTDPTIPRSRSPRILSDRARVMDAITAYQLTSMLQGVVERGTASASVNLPVPTAGKTGTTNDAKDVWFVGFTSNVVAGCYIGYDDPRPLGRGASGGGFCGPVFQRFMSEAINKYGGGKFKIPPGGHFIKIDRFTGARLPDSASGPNVVAEYFRDGEEPIFGVSFDGGFAMGSDLPLFDEARGGAREVTTSTGRKAVVGPKASFGTMSSGGLY
ncbi:penicillin-binding protein 1A [Pseudooceanicola batsensis HTCC2597]|uniref:Penicillin-binding protein 1A n=1 Tax=Pseudooceanicola batsensis (strain ATCC BAA-863 / DSM 15984 / KCTC 12145 / HTCC2597) TaxID=252305 RepID=A3U2G0_PSEBH|nr:PBP1A family penicillin-binding protein [Pseudooceanicola batsensis]EAQ01760.1 penicillin-binding protein 1A [Pseudooceanicola batsensis HTCC2597]